MALIAHMTIEGTNQGEITKGAGRLKGREDTVEVYAFEHTVAIPKDRQSGRIIGQRFHQPVVIVKEIDKTSPLLSQALVTAETLTVRIDFWRFSPDGSGRQEQFYTVELDNAQLVSSKQELPFVKDPETAQYPLLERLEIAFERISGTFQDGGIMYEDDWTNPVA